MVSPCSASFLLASFGLYLGFSLDTVETVSEERMVFFRNVAEAYDSQSPSQRQKTLLLFKSVGSNLASPARSKRATESCQSGPITASALEDPLFVIQYDSVEQFDACLSDEVLKANLAPLLEQPLPDDYLAVIKRKLDEIYPDGIPDDQLKQLSYLSRLYSPAEISKWRVTSGDALAALLSPDNGAWKPDQLKQLISTYMELGGTLTGPLLSTLGGANLCLLEAGQLGQISPESVRQAEKLDISSCSQDKKDILYEKARVAFAGQEETSAYYPLIQPYLAGAPVEDLRKLARSQVAMDIDTFTNLKPEELKKLSVQDVKDLLAVHLPDLKDVENHPSVAMWIKSHLQSELDTLGIGLQGGMSGPSPTGSTDVGGTTADGPSIAIPASAATMSAMSTAAISDANATSFSDTSTFPSVATDSFTTPLFKATLAVAETSASTETTNATSTGIPSEAAIPTNPVMTVNVTATSEDPVDRSLVPTTAVNTGTTATSATSASRDITTNGTVLEVGGGVDMTTSVVPATVFTNVTTDGTHLPTVASHVNATTSVDTTVVFTNVTTNGTSLPTVASHINTTTSVNTTVVFTNVTTNGTSLPTIASHINTTTSVNTTMVFTNVTTDGTSLPTIASHINATTSVDTTVVFTNVPTDGTSLPTVASQINTTTNVTIDGAIQPSVASQINATTSVNTTVASTNITTDGTLQPTVASHINTITSVDTTTVSTNITIDGTSLPTVASHLNTTTSVNTTVASTNITTNGPIQPTVAPHINATTSVNTTVASTNITTAWATLPTIARNGNVTSTPNATISHTPALNINHTSTAPNLTATMSSEWPPTPPVPLPNATVPVSLSTPPVTSGKIPAASSRTTVRSFETPHKTTASPSPDQPHTAIVGTPERGTTSRAPPETKQPPHPTPNGYINVRPLSASASSLSLSCLLLTPSIVVGLSVLRGLF